MTVVSVALAAVQAAGVIWNWWQSRQASATQVTIRTAGGHVIELAGIDQNQLEILLGEDE